MAGVAEDAADEAEFEVLVEEEKTQKRDQVIQDLMNELKYREQLYVLTSMHYQFKNLLFVLPILIAGTGEQAPAPVPILSPRAIRVRAMLAATTCGCIIVASSHGAYGHSALGTLLR